MLKINKAPIKSRDSFPDKREFAALVDLRTNRTLDISRNKSILRTNEQSMNTVCFD